MDILVVLVAMSTMVQGFLVPSSTFTCYNKVLPQAPATVKRWTSRSSSRDLPEANTHSREAALLLALNQSRVDATVLAESKTPAGAYQITRPRWYSKAEVAIILLLVQRWVRVSSTCDVTCSDALPARTLIICYRDLTNMSEMIMVPPQAISALFQ